LFEFSNFNMNIIKNYKQKSLSQRFLFVLGLVFLFMYVFLGITLFIWKAMPVEIPYTRRVLLGVILIVYALIRFYRLNANASE
jgi:cytochrome c biogenesis protein CcdA